MKEKPMTRKDAVEKAKNLVSHLPVHAWPEDDWIALAPAWDLNVFGAQERQATLYPARLGSDGYWQTDTMKGITIL